MWRLESLGKKKKEERKKEKVKRGVIYLVLALAFGLGSLMFGARRVIFVVSSYGALIEFTFASNFQETFFFSAIEVIVSPDLTLY